MSLFSNAALYTANTLTNELTLDKIPVDLMLRRLRLVVRTPDFQSGNTGSIPVGATKQ